jgi:hypothetical protein
MSLCFAGMLMFVTPPPSHPPLSLFVLLLAHSYSAIVIWSSRLMTILSVESFGAQTAKPQLSEKMSGPYKV